MQRKLAPGTCAPQLRRFQAVAWACKGAVGWLNWTSLHESSYALLSFFLSVLLYHCE